MAVLPFKDLFETQLVSRCIFYSILELDYWLALG